MVIFGMPLVLLGTCRRISRILEAVNQFPLFAVDRFSFDVILGGQAQLRVSLCLLEILASASKASYPLLLGLNPQGCYDLGVRVYVYDTLFAARPVECSQGMFASEVFVPRILTGVTVVQISRPGCGSKWTSCIGGSRSRVAMQ